MVNQALQTGAMDRIWCSVQAFLVAAGNISKLLWPPKPLLPERGAELRANLSVGDDSPLEPRTFRNHFEYFDTTDFAVTFRRDVYHLQPVINAIRNLWQKAAVEAEKPHWE